jgi:hypothetical protein
MSIVYSPDYLKTWTLEQLCEIDEDEDEESFERNAFERRRRMEEVIRREAVEVARRRAESCKAQRKERRVAAAGKREEEPREMCPPAGMAPLHDQMSIFVCSLGLRGLV